MFDNIPLTSYTAPERLSPRQLTEDVFDEKKYERDNLLNSNYSIIGSVDTITLPPITEYAKMHLNHLHAFNVFHYKSPSFTERKNYPSFLIAYTYSGSGTLTYRDKEYTLARGDGFFINCMDYHFYKAQEDNWDTAIIHLRGPLLQDMHEQYMQAGTAVFHDALEGDFQKQLEQLLYLYTAPHVLREWQASSCIDSLITYLMVQNAGLSIERTQAPKYIRYLVKYMESNYESALTLDFLADFANVNKYYLLREFKKYTGFTPNDYLISLRINKAKQLLLNTTLPAIKIAHEVGIHDINNFNNLFKRRVKMTPTQYRKSHDSIA